MSNQVVTTQQKANELRSLLTTDAMQKQFKLAMPKVLTPERFLRCLMTEVQRIPELLDCTRESVLASAMIAAQLGLEIGGAQGQFYILPFRDNRNNCSIATPIIGYKGMVSLFYRSPLAQGLQAEAVYEKDDFDYSYGLEPKLHFRPSQEEDRGNLTHAFAIATLKGGGTVWRVLNRQQIMKAKATSKAANSGKSPWQTHEDTMWVKTAIRALASRMPQSPELADAIAAEDAADFGYANAVSVSAASDSTAVTTTDGAKTKTPTPTPADTAPTPGLTLLQQVNAAQGLAVNAGIPMEQVDDIAHEASGGKRLSACTEAELKLVLDRTNAVVKGRQ